MTQHVVEYMAKLRSDSNWTQLTCRQRQTMEQWLFDQHLSYDAILDRVKNEFGLEASRTSLCRYYQRRARERQMAELVDAQAMSDALAAPEFSTDSMRAAAVKVIARMTLKLACERPDQLKELESLAKILLLSEDNDIRRARFQLEREQFRYETLSAASEELPNLARLLLAIEEDENLSQKEKMERVHALLYPESARLGLCPACSTKRDDAR